MQNQDEKKNKSNLKEMENVLVDRLMFVRDVMNKQRDDLAVSVRKDVIAVELKQMLLANTDFHSLKNAIEEYIENLYENIQVLDEESEDNEKDK